MKKFNTIIHIILWAQLLLITQASAKSCELTNDALQAMHKTEITIINANQQELSVVVKTADNNLTRQAGFQHVCAETIAAQPILFLFGSPIIPNFHMNNVVAPIDIAFIDQEGRIESIQAMFPYVLISLSRPLYSPEREVVAALEARPGFYQENDIEVGDLIIWEK